MAVEITYDDLWLLCTLGTQYENLKVAAGGLYMEVITTLLSAIVRTSMSSSSETDVASMTEPALTKIALPYWRCGLSATRTMPGMVGRLLSLPLWVSCRQRTSQGRLLQSSAKICCFAVEKPSTLAKVMVRAGAGKVPL